MKKPLFTIFILLAAVGLFFGGWHFGQRTAVKIGSDVLLSQEYGRAFTQLAEFEVVVEEIDSGKIEDAKNMIHLNMDGNILALDNLSGTNNSNTSLSDLKILIQIDKDSQSQWGSHRQVTEKLLARVAKYRAAHPLKYSGALQMSIPEVQAKVDGILKRAAESQK